MVVYVVSGGSYGIGLELVRQISSDSRNVVFAILRSARSAERLASLTSARDNIRVYFAEEDRQAGFEIIARDISKCIRGVDVIINNVAWLDDCLSVNDLPLSGHRGDQINDLQQFFSTHVLGTIGITNACLPLLQRGGLKKVVTITSEEAAYNYTLLPSGLDVGVAYAMAKTALNTAVMRYSALPELKRDEVICASIECRPRNPLRQRNILLGEDQDTIIQNASEEVLRAISGLTFEDSGRYIRLKEEQDLIIL